MNAVSHYVVFRPLLGICAGLLALLTSACTGAKSIEQEQSMLDEFHITCLKSGLAVNTSKHVDCVAALYEARQRQLARLQSIVTPAKAESAGSSGASSNSPTNQ